MEFKMKAHHCVVGQPQSLSILFGSLFLILMIAGVPNPAHADASPGSAIHGFGSLQFSNDYITPRGLLVTNEGVTAQGLGGLVFILPKGFSAVAGAWNDIDAVHQHAPGVGAWVEEDFFIGVGYQATKRLKFSVTYDNWNFPGTPPAVPDNEQNIEFTVNYDDASPSSLLSLQPHATLFWAVASHSSTVVLGRPANEGTSAYLELGVTPTLAVRGTPITVTMPTWVSVGDPRFWCENSSATAMIVEGVKGRGCTANNFGVFTTGLTVKSGLPFISSAYGSWYVYAGVQYYNLLNGALVDAQYLTIGSPDGHRNVVNGLAGIGFGF